MTFKGFIFDLDGVITDTAEYHYLAWQKLCDDQGWAFTKEDNDRLRGVSRMASLDIILEINQITLPDETKQRLADDKNNAYLAYLEHITPKDLLPNILDFIKEAKASGILIGLGSASKNALTVLKRLNTLTLFDVIGDGHSVVNSKPAPDLFVWVAGAMRLNPKQCVVFEDAASGVDAALAGGFWVVGIGTQDRLPHAHLRYDTTTSLGVATVLALQT